MSVAAHADTPPRLLSAPEVTVDREEIPEGSSILLRLEIDESGSIRDAVVVEGLRTDIDSRVRDAAMAMHFVPGERGGAPVATIVRFRFRLRSIQQVSASSSSSPPPVGASESSPNFIVPNRVQLPASASSSPPPSEAGVVVRGHYEPGAATRMSFHAEELTTVPGTFGEPTRIVASQPGVARTPFGLGYFVVRGASFENTGFFVDGFPVLVLYHLAAGPAVISSRLIGQLDFYPGGYPLQYGGFTAGVISLETRPPPTNRPHAEAEVDVFRASLLGVLPFDHGRGSVAVAVRRSYYDFILPYVLPGLAVNYTDGQIRADYRFTDRLRTSLFIFGSMDYLDRTQIAGAGSTAQTSRDGLIYNFWRAIAKLEYQAPHGISAQVSAMLGYDETSVIFADPGRPNRGLRAAGNLMGERASVRIPMNAVLTTTVGLDALAYVYDTHVSFASPASLLSVPTPSSNARVADINASIDQFGITAYIEEVLHAGRLELTAGSRLEYLRYGSTSHVLADPRAVARVRLREGLQVIAATGIFHQAPPFFALVPGAGNPNLLPEQAWQSSLGIEAQLPLQIDARVTGFYNRMWQLARATYAIVMGPSGPERALALSDGQGQAYGLEVLIRRRLARGIYGWISYTLSRSERWIEDPITHQVIGRVVPFTYDQTHILNLAASWDVTSHWRVGAKFQLATGSPTSAINGAIYDADADGYRPQYVSEAARLPTFTQLDVRVDYRFHAGPFDLSVYLDILNVYNAPNTEGWVYQYDYADRVPSAGLPILPTLGIRGEI